MEITANQLIGLNVYSLNRGERIGIVRNFLLDPKEKELIALLVGNKKIIKDESVLCLADAAGVSLEAVTVDSPAALRKKSECAHLKELLKSPPDINGLSVLKKDGAFLGKAVSFYIDTETGKITRFELNSGFFSSLLKDRRFLSVDHVDIIGADMILAKDDAKVEEDQSAVHTARIKEKTAKLRAAKEAEPGCRDKIMALSGKAPFHRHHKIIFPEIDREAETETKESQ